MASQPSTTWSTPPPLHSGDLAAVVAPSSGAATFFPHCREQGLARLRSEFGLEALAMPSAGDDRDKSPSARALDLLLAFEDDTVRCVVCTIGGDDLVRVIPYLLREGMSRGGEVQRSLPSILAAGGSSRHKFLLGFSDITALHLLLWKCRVKSMYGGTLLCQFAVGADSAAGHGSGKGGGEEGGGEGGGEGRPAQMHLYTLRSMRAALFRTGDNQPAAAATAGSAATAAAGAASFEASPAASFLDGYPDWSDPSNLCRSAPMEPNGEGWIWNDAWGRAGASMGSGARRGDDNGDCDDHGDCGGDGKSGGDGGDGGEQDQQGDRQKGTDEQTDESAARRVRGRLWGGCLSSLYKVLACGPLLTQALVPTAEELDGCVLFVETSESMPSSNTVYDFFAALGERDLLGCFAAVMVGRPQTMDQGRVPPEGRAEYRILQRGAIQRAVDEYVNEPREDAGRVDGGVGGEGRAGWAAKVPIVFNVEFGHTNPQLLVPSGGYVVLDGASRSIVFEYGEDEGEEDGSGSVVGGGRGDGGGDSDAKL